MQLNEAHKIANGLVEWLGSSCDRIEIAGSIRRGKADVKDIEIVAIAKLVKVPQPYMFGPNEEAGIANLKSNQSIKSRLEIAVGVLTQMPNPWQFDPDLKRNGEKYKRLKHIDSGMICDLFITTPEKWGLIYAIRTGPADFSKAIVLKFLSRGWHQHGGQLHGHPKRNGKPCEKGTRCQLIIPTPEEVDVFNVLSWKYLAADERHTQGVKRSM